jgi:hypothetical protein
MSEDQLLAKRVALFTLENAIDDINRYYNRVRNLRHGKFKHNSAIGVQMKNARDAKLWVEEKSPHLLGFKWCMNHGQVRPRDFERCYKLALKGYYAIFKSKGRL